MRLKERFKRLTLWNKLGVIGAIASVVGVIITVFNLVPQQETLSSLNNPAEKPDVGLGFYRPKKPQFRIVNLSNVVIRDPKYQFLLYDMDLPGTDQPYMNLRIPVEILPDYIRPRGNLGPFGILALSPKRASVDQEHRLFGYAQIQCPNCTYFRKYWVFVDLGQGKGWYAPIPESEHNRINRHLAIIIHGKGDPLSKIEALVPEKEKILFS